MFVRIYLIPCRKEQENFIAILIQRHVLIHEVNLPLVTRSNRSAESSGSFSTVIRMFMRFAAR